MFSNNFEERDDFECSKCVCFHCNKNGYFSYNCPFKKGLYFETKLVWVPKTNHEGLKTKMVPNVN